MQGWRRRTSWAEIDAELERRSLDGDWDATSSSSGLATTFVAARRSGSRIVYFVVGDETDPTAPVVVASSWPPGKRVEPHSHLTDYAEVLLAGSQQVARTWHERGDVRIVTAGTTYGPLTAGPDGASFIAVFREGSRMDMVTPQAARREKRSASAEGPSRFRQEHTNWDELAIRVEPRLLAGTTSRGLEELATAARAGGVPMFWSGFSLGGPDDEGAPVVALGKWPPGHEVPAHTYRSDYAELVLDGEKWVGDERVGPGDIQVLGRGTQSGPVRSGKAGATFLAIFRGPEVGIDHAAA